MLKLTVAVLALAFATTASAAGWRSLQIDASSEESFSKSVAEFKEDLPAARWYVFARALQDVWVEGSEDAEAEQREYTTAEYLQQVDGLRYKEVVRLTDPSGQTARTRYRAVYARTRMNRAGPVVAQGAPPSQPGMIGFSGEQVRGIDNQAHAMQQRLMDKGTLH